MLLRPSRHRRLVLRFRLPCGRPTTQVLGHALDQAKTPQICGVLDGLTLRRFWLYPFDGPERAVYSVPRRNPGGGQPVARNVVGPGGRSACSPRAESRRERIGGEAAV